jgi:hypothetical protein
MVVDLDILDIFKVVSIVREIPLQKVATSGYQISKGPSKLN